MRALSLRIAEKGYIHIEERAARADVDVSHMVRRMLSYASANMPEGWVPPRESQRTTAARPVPKPGK